MKKLAKILFIVGTFVFGITTEASAKLCFTAFGGTVHYQFSTTATKLRTAGIRPLVGTNFGSLAACAGLSQWPLVGASITTSKDITLGFRAMTVDASGCGAVDYIVSLDPKTLSGNLQLHNDRNNGSNTSQFVKAACTTPPGFAAPVPSDQFDPNAN